MKIRNHATFIFTRFNFFFLLFLLAAHIKSAAQPERGDKELMVSYGFYSGTEMIGMNNAYGAYSEAGYVQTAHSGNLFITYRNFITDNFAVGFTAGTQFLAYQYVNNGSNYSYENFSTKAYITTLALECKRIWMAHIYIKNFQFYGFMGLGVRLLSEKQSPVQPRHTISPVHFNSQWSPLCVRYGDKFGGLAEFGFGYKGLLNLGLYYKFIPADRPINIEL